MSPVRLLPLAALAFAGSAMGQHEAHAPPARATVADWAKGAQLFDDLGTFHRKVTTGSPEAQKYFDQGMRLVWAFNHDEATRSFARAAELDPKCASCFWGVALTLGPNYNMPLMAEPRARAGWEALGKAQANVAAATPVEQALIAALAKRFDGPKPLDPSNSAPHLAAYVTAMEGVARRFPADLDVQTMLAEGLMNTNPWKLWTADGKPGPGTPEILTALQKVLARDPKHPGANHYWIHAVEASPDPARAVPSADALVGMMPAAGHLEHMPAHIYQRVGRYEESAEANRKGAAADVAYLKLTSAPDYYPMYLIHNYQFLAYSAAMEGRRAETVKAIRDARSAVSDAMLLAMPGLDWSIGYLYDGMARFGLWDDPRRARAEPEAPRPHHRLASGASDGAGRERPGGGGQGAASGAGSGHRRSARQRDPGPECRQAALRDRRPQGEGADRAHGRAAGRGPDRTARGREKGGPAVLQRAVGRILPGAAPARRGPDRGEAAGASRSGLSRGPAPPPKQRLGAARAGQGAGSAREESERGAGAV
jgi:hypothetical protein